MHTEAAVTAQASSTDDDARLLMIIWNETGFYGTTYASYLLYDTVQVLKEGIIKANNQKVVAIYLVRLYLTIK